MLQILSIARAQVKAGNTSENLLNEICYIVYSLFRENEITKNAYFNIMNSIQLEYKIDTMFTNSENAITKYFR